MQKHKNKQNALLIAVVILLLAAAGGAWYYFSSLKPVLEIVTDKPAYFSVDKPSVEIKLLNPGSADSGEVRVDYDKNVLKLVKSEHTNGVSMRELDKSLIFTLSNDYFSSKNPVVSKLTFERADEGATGSCKFVFDKTNSKLLKGTENLNIGEYKDRTVSIGVVPES